MTIIEQTNDIVRAAIVAVRIERNPLTMGQLYDALRKRRTARDYVMPQWEREAWNRMHYTEMTLVEKINVIEVQRLKLSQSGFITYL